MRGYVSLACSAALLVLMGAIAPAHAVTEPMPGLWKVTSKAERNDGPITEGLRTICITPEQAKAMTSNTVQSSGRPSSCQRLDFKKTSNSVSWRTQCQGPTLDTTTSYVFDSARHYTGVIKSTLSRPDKKIESTLQIVGERIGECRK